VNLKESEKYPLEKQFDETALELFNKYALKTPKSDYRLVEIEFYFNSEQLHKDEYTHKHEYEAGYWRSHNGGLDITLRGENGGHGGILIRSVRRLSDNKYINGPRNVLTALLQELGSVFNSSSSFYLEKDSFEEEVDESIWLKTSRFGLSDKYPDFKEKHYRYIIELNKRNKIKDRENIYRKHFNTLNANEFLGYQLKI
jgi:hypothetical protein